jgi:hypothetical protein
MYKEAVLAVLVCIFFAVMVSLALTGLYLHDFSETCNGSGGNFSIDGGTAWCRY